MKKKQGLAQPCTDGHPQEIGASEDHESPQSTDAGSAWPKRLKSTDAASAWPKRHEIDWFPDSQRASQKEQSQNSHNSIRSIDKESCEEPDDRQTRRKRVIRRMTQEHILTMVAIPNHQLLGKYCRLRWCHGEQCEKQKTCGEFLVSKLHLRRKFSLR